MTFKLVAASGFPSFSVAQVQVARAVQLVLDAAIQLHEGAGVCNDF